MKPRKKRDVLYPPNVQYFKPQGIPLHNLITVCVTVDEYEAVRLADYEKLKHEEAAKQMNISRPTFTRLLESAHNKISDAIVNGKAVRIEGGDFNFLGKRYRCRKCGFYWDIEKYVSTDLNCPKCNDSEIDDVGEKLVSQVRHGRGGRFGHGWDKQ
jgi:predicted DNA-binding protein (UPF0251 family)